MVSVDIKTMRFKKDCEHGGMHAELEAEILGINPDKISQTFITSVDSSLTVLR